MRRVLILWAEGRSPNLGVRALAEGTAALVRKADYNCEVDFQNYGRGPSPVNIGAPRTVLGECIISRYGLEKFVKSYDLVIDTGAGDSFSDIYGLKRLLGFWTMARFVQRCKVPFVLGPQTIGPFDTRVGQQMGASTLRSADAVMVRDRISAEASRRLGRTPEVLSTDVVFALPVPEPIRTYDILLNVSGLLWNKSPHIPSNDYHMLVKDLINGLRAKGRSVTLLAHVLDAPTVDNDIPTVRELAERFELDFIIPSSLSEVREVVAGANIVIGSRMHACLNALSVGTPTIPLAYSRKFAPLLDGIGWPHHVDMRSDPNSAATVLEIALHSSDLPALAAEAKARAEEHLLLAQHALEQLL